MSCLKSILLGLIFAQVIFVSCSRQNGNYRPRNDD